MLAVIFLAVALLLLVANRAAAANPEFPPDLGADDADRLKQDLTPVLSLSDKEILKLIPERSGLYFIDCPNCDGGAQEGMISWSIRSPDEVFCKACGIRYPNDKFPDDKVLEVQNSLGEIHHYPYWEAPDPPNRSLRSSVQKYDLSGGYRHFFQAKGWYLAREYFANAALELGQLFHVTGDVEYARRAALILNRFAEVYPGYCVHYDLPFQQKIVFPGEQAFPYPVEDYRAAKWSWWAYMDIPDDLIRAYDLIRDSEALDPETAARIEEVLLHGCVAFARQIPVALSNMDPTLLKGLIIAGRALKRPDYIHDAVDRIRRLVEGQFFFDGMWMEGALSYHNQTVGGLNNLIDLLHGYTDPQGYVHPENGERFDNLNLAERFPILSKAQRIPELLSYPNGHVVATHDTWPREGHRRSDRSTPMLLAGVGQGRLGTGSGTDQVQAHLHFSGSYGHAHADLLTMTLFSHGQERLGDLGYTHTRYRCWTLSTLSHNTVVVDGMDQTYGSKSSPSTDGNLLLYVPSSDGLQAIEASGERGYPGVTRVYRRLLLLVPISSSNAYLVDIFYVEGGDRHEYVLVGDPDHDGDVHTDVKLDTYGPMLLPDGVSVTYPTGESVQGDAEGHNLGYAFIRDVDRSDIQAPWTLDFNSEAIPGGNVRIHRLSPIDNVQFLGQAPSIRRANEDDNLIDDITMPITVHRREGQDLSSTFASVMEPLSDKPFLDSVELLDLDSGSGIAIRVSAGDTTDYVIVGSDANAKVEVDGMRLEGRIGFVRTIAGDIVRMNLIGGNSLQAGDRSLAGGGTISGRIIGTLRKVTGDEIDGIRVEGSLSSEEVEGSTVVVHDSEGFTYGHRVVGSSVNGNSTVLELEEDPAFEVGDGGGGLLFFPGRSWKGETRFEIATSATMSF